MNISEEIIKKHGQVKRENLIPVLLELEENQGYISEDNIKQLSTLFGIPTSKIYSITSFYNLLRLHKKGKFHIKICRGTSCHIMKNKDILEILNKLLHIKAGETTKDQLFSIELTDCNGSCHLAPVVMINEEVISQATTEGIKNRIKEIMQAETKNEQ